MTSLFSNIRSHNYVVCDRNNSTKKRDSETIQTREYLMKVVIFLPTLVLLATLAGCVSALAQESINVRIHPDPNSTLIGKLSSLSLAVTADWPKDTKPVSGWRPIHYRGEFLVYLDSQDIGKNFQ